MLNLESAVNLTVVVLWLWSDESARILYSVTKLINKMRFKFSEIILELGSEEMDYVS